MTAKKARKPAAAVQDTEEEEEALPRLYAAAWDFSDDNGNDYQIVVIGVAQPDQGLSDLDFEQDSDIALRDLCRQYAEGRIDRDGFDNGYDKMGRDDAPDEVLWLPARAKSLVGRYVLPANE